jgi:hypothetical protein
MCRLDGITQKTQIRKIIHLKFAVICVVCVKKKRLLCQKIQQFERSDTKGEQILPMAS